MKEIIEKIHAYFEGISSAIAQYIDLERDMDSYYLDDANYENYADNNF